MNCSKKNMITGYPNPFSESGLCYVGEISHHQVNNGHSVPLFEPAAPKDRPDINTLDGWNALTDKANRKAFGALFGRQPTCDDELKAWESSSFNEHFRWIREI